MSWPLAADTQGNIYCAITSNTHAYPWSPSPSLWPVDQGWVNRDIFNITALQIFCNSTALPDPV